MSPGPPAALVIAELTASNLIHSPNEPGLEGHIVDLYLRRGVRGASAYMALSPHVVRYALHGLRTGADGRIERLTGGADARTPAARHGPHGARGGVPLHAAALEA